MIGQQRAPWPVIWTELVRQAFFLLRVAVRGNSSLFEKNSLETSHTKNVLVSSTDFIKTKVTSSKSCFVLFLPNVSASQALPILVQALICEERINKQSTHMMLVVTERLFWPAWSVFKRSGSVSTTYVPSWQPASCWGRSRGGMFWFDASYFALRVLQVNMRGSV